MVVTFLLNTMKKGNPNPVTAWKPGQSGNPKGAPKKENRISESIDKILNMSTIEYEAFLLSCSRKEKDANGREKIVFKPTKNVTVKDILAIQYLKHAVNGDKIILMDHRDRTEGKAQQNVDVKSDGQRLLIADFNALTNGDKTK